MSTNSKDMTGAPEFKKMGHVTLITPLLGVVCHPQAKTWHILPAHKIDNSSFSRSRYDWCTKKFKCVTWADHAHFWGGLSTAV